MAQVDMTMSSEESKELAETTSDSKYPWGLRITLDDDSLAKLGITQLPAVGTTMTLNATVEVCSTSAYADKEGEPENSVSLQITAMELNGERDTSDAATMLYGGDND